MKNKDSLIKKIKSGKLAENELREIIFPRKDFKPNNIDYDVIEAAIQTIGSNTLRDCYFPRHHISYYFKEDHILKLLSKGIPFELELTLLGPRNNLLALAASKNYFKLADLLLENGFDVNGDSQYLTTPLDFAMISNNEKMIDYLIEKGAKIRSKDSLNENFIYEFDSVCYHIALAKLEFNNRSSLHIKPSRPINKDLFNSKYGGSPTLPVGMKWPMDKKDISMSFVGQLKLSEIKKRPIKLPNTGYLYFFVDESLSGEHKVIFHPQEDFEYKKMNSDVPILFNKCYPLKFTSKMEKPTSSNYYFHKILSNEIKGMKNFPNYSYNFVDVFYEDRYPHKIGGHPSFVQDDPINENHESLINLLQVDQILVKGERTVWGDTGIAHFFISKEDLDKESFDNTKFEWSFA